MPERIVCPFPMYDKLAARCVRSGWWLELHRIGSGMELRVTHRGEGQCDVAAAFNTSRPDEAAALLLQEVG